MGSTKPPYRRKFPQGPSPRTRFTRLRARLTIPDLSRFRMLYFTLWIVVPIVTMPFAVSLVDSTWYTPRVVAYIELLYPLFFCCYALIVQTRLPTVFNESLPRRSRLIFVAAVSGQLSLHALLVIAGGMTSSQKGLHVALFIIAFFFAVFILCRPSFTLMLLYCVSYLALCLWAITDFYLRLEFDFFSTTFETLADSLTLPALCVLSLAAVMSMALRRFRPLNSQGPLRYAVGLAVVLVLVMFGDFYYKSALFTNGDAFEYTKKAITLQSKRGLVALFPDLPSKLYDSLIEESLSSHSPLNTFTDTRSGIRLYGAGADDMIGGFWADFYKRRLRLEGATHFRLVKFDKPTNIINSDLYELLLYKLGPSSSDPSGQSSHSYVSIKPYDGTTTPFTKYIVEIPRSTAYTYHTSPSEGVNIGSSPAKTMHIVDLEHPHLDIITHLVSKSELIPDIYAYYLLNIDNLSLYLGHASNYLDDSALKVRDITGTDYLDSYGDYLYFSIITMSTTGYGDIVAIHPTVRALTIGEIVFGWFLLLWFGSLIIAGINKGTQHKGEQNQLPVGDSQGVPRESL